MKSISRSFWTLFFVLISIIGLVGCATKPSADIEAVPVAEPAAVTEVQEAAVPEAEPSEPVPTSVTVSPVAASEPAPVVEAKPLEYEIDIFGYKAEIEAYDGHADVSYPAFVTDEEIGAAAAAALKAYPQYLNGVTYEISVPGKLVVYFQKGLTAADADYAVDLLQKELTWYVNQLFSPVPELETPIEEPEEIIYPYGINPIVKDDSGAEDFSIYIVHTNDVHARVEEGTDGSMGYAKLATLLKWGRSLTDDILLLDAGDVTHGTNFANLFQGQTILNILDMLDYDAVVPGNHDFNYGYEVLLEDAELAAKYSDTKILCANVLDESGTLLFQPYQIYDFNGFKVAVIGLTTPDTKTKAHPKYTVGLSFMSDVVVDNAQYAVDLAHQYADYVVVLGHIGEDADGSSGITSDWICANINGIDLFVDGHSHTDQPGKYVNGALIVQAGQYLDEVGVVELNIKDGKVTSQYSVQITAEDVLNPVGSELAAAYGITQIPADQEVSAYIDSVNAELDEIYDEVVAVAPVKLDGERANVRTKQTNLTKLICQALTEESGADFTIINGGGIRASIPKGNVTVGQINDVLPFTNTLVAVEMTGNQVYEAFEHGYRLYPEQNAGFSQTDLQVVFNTRGKAGSRILKVFLNGKEIPRDETVYKCATNDFLAAGGDSYTMMGKIVYIGRVLSEVFTDYMKANYPVK